ncbi:MAG TPA: Tad domain-containing protein [Geminicoccaceae bacterium]|nr:Tad domain-containing protein [Geminicoccaceae bacterium]
MKPTQQPLTSDARLARDEGGAIALYVTAIIGVVLGFGALVIDGGRLASLHSELQSFADHVALAAAGELDGNPGALARATAASRLVIADRHTFGRGPGGLDPSSVGVRFLSGLPASDEQPITAGFATASDRAGLAVEVTLAPVGIDYWFVPGFSALAGSAAGAGGGTATGAVAGMTQYICDIAPVMFCSPNGSSYDPVPGRQILLKTQNFWGPGAFGLLDVNYDPNGPCGAPNEGADYWRCVVGATRGITKCFARRGVNIRPGQMSGAAAAGFNTRFDIYENSLQGRKNDPDFAPAPHVVKGIGAPGGCILGNTQTYTDSQRLPRDSCFAGGSCANGNRFGNQIWDKAGYWAKNHGTVVPAATTRYQLYQHELAQAGTSRILPAPRTETGRPTCSGSTPVSAERRVIVAAVIDCSLLPPGNAANVPVLKFVRLLMTEPAGIDSGGSGTELWVEEIDEVRPSGAGNGLGILHEVVQLHR